MKHFTILFVCLLLSIATQAQVLFGVRGGFNTTDIEAEQLLITNDETLQAFNLAVADVKFGVHAGLFLKVPITDFIFIQPEVLFNSNRVDFQRDDTEGIFREKYQYLDIPVIAGFQFGPIKPQFGLVGHVFLRSNSELDIEGYRQDFRDLTVGWQGGLGLEFGDKFLVDVRYEGNLSKFGNHITVAGEEYAFDDRPSRLVFILGYAF
ncbi:MAG: porin family protein [Bacteroidota bacterium]